MIEHFTFFPQILYNPRCFQGKPSVGSNEGIVISN